MAKIGKSSIKRSQPSYFMAILGVTVVLFFVGIFGWLIINASKYTEVLKENIQVQVYLRNTAVQKDVDSLTAWLKTKPYADKVEYIDKEAAKKKLLASGGEKDFKDMIEGNPLPASVEFHLKSQYVIKDTLEAIKADILNGRDLMIESVNYPSAIVEKMGPIP